MSSPNRRRKSPVIAAILALSSAIALAFCLPGTARAGDAVRVTTSFDHRQCPAVLRQVSKALAGGFDRSAAEKLAGEIEALPADRRKSWDFTVTYQGAAHPMHVQALVDDLGMIDLDFATDAVLAPAIRSAVDSYINSRN